MSGPPSPRGGRPIPARIRRRLWTRALPLRAREKSGELFYALYPDFDTRYWGYFTVYYSDFPRPPSIDVSYVTDDGSPMRIVKGVNDKDPKWKKYLYPEKETPKEEMDVGVIKMFYEMYPDSDPKYWSSFKFVKHTKGGELDSIDVYYRTDRGTVRIIKGENDEDVRWRKFLHSSPPLVPSERHKGDPTGGTIPPRLGSPRDTNTLNSEDIITLAIIGGTSAYILWTFCRIVL